jgi:hypothetical protein
VRGSGGACGLRRPARAKGRSSREAGRS